MRVVYFLLIVCRTVAVAGEVPPCDATGVSVGEYRGWPECVTLSGAGRKAVIVPGIGARVLELSLNGENMLFSSPGSDGKTLDNQTRGFWAGGYQIDIGPEIRKLPDHQRMWMGPWTTRVLPDGSVHGQSVADAATGVQLEKTIRLAANGAVHVKHRMKNISTAPVSYCLWDRTLCQGGGYAFFPLGKKSRFAKGWALRKARYGEDAYETQNPQAENVKVLDGVLVVHCLGEDGKLGADSDAGWIAYVRGTLLYVKIFKFDTAGKYTDGGNSVEVYWSKVVGEVEPLSPEVTLQPQESYDFDETWHLLQLDAPVTSFEQARMCVKEVNVLLKR